VEPGILTSDEPGLYLEGEYGIRTENLLICQEAETNEFGRFLEFETVTMAPIDKDAIDWSLMTAEEIEWLNQYHQKVYDTISPALNEEERNWLKEACGRV
ncbi:MAG: M24 family metallopeptidase C-terminal domain-containing protein, partial [Lachnospiraceae bacterium]|nr:M24 family metallopeptidase C-terminal domain-containing protein [Lachnospiraceae bacterium]